MTKVLKRELQKEAPLTQNPLAGEVSAEHLMSEKYPVEADRPETVLL